jgi:short-subunit dehydrogenase
MAVHQYFNLLNFAFMKKNILITGAGTGIGRDTAFELVKRGHQVIATTETETQAIALRSEAQKMDVPMDIFKLDITSPQDRALVKTLEIDVLINNAGIGESGCIAEIDMEKVRNNFEVNVFSTFELSQIVLKKMFVKNTGTVIFISSLAGRVPITFLGPYSMTKAAVSSVVDTMRKEIHRVRKHVHVCLVEPGSYNTGFNQKNIAKMFEWMDESSIFYPIINDIKEEGYRLFKLTESRSTRSIVRRIVRASEAKKPGLRYSAPVWQAIGIQLQRVFGR